MRQIRYAIAKGFVAIGFMVVIAGCQSTAAVPSATSCPGGTGAGDVSGNNEATANSKVRYIGYPEIAISDMRCIASNDLLRIDVDVVNQKAEEQRIEYRFLWFEANGMSIGPDEVWKPLLLYPEESRTIRTASPSQAAQDFTLVIKRY